MVFTTNMYYHMIFHQTVQSISKYRHLSESPSEQATEQLKTVAGANSQILLLQKREGVQSGWRTETLIRTSPVYVESFDGKERLVYNRKEMQYGKLYKILWEGQQWALRKNEEGKVDLYEFESDG
jgi:hypothetical protein